MLEGIINMKPEVERILTTKDINPTANRMLVLDYLLELSSSISLTDLELSLASFDRVTLYRTIKTFEEKGLVHKIEDGSGITKFALCQDSCEEGRHHDLHVHFYCHNCKQTFCLPKTKIPEVTLPANYQNQEMELTVKGICASCAE